MPVFWYVMLAAILLLRFFSAFLFFLIFQNTFLTLFQTMKYALIFDGYNTSRLVNQCVHYCHTSIPIQTVFSLRPCELP